MSGVSFRRRKNRPTVDLNVTSMVDVLFLLLIFFTLTSTFKRAGELDLNLPKSTTAGAAGGAGTNAEQPLDLVLTEKGMLLLDGGPITFEALPPRLLAAREAKPDRQVLIEAEKEVPHEQVVRLLDAVRTAGFTGVGIGVRASEGRAR